jgi:hypothetical protein
LCAKIEAIFEAPFAPKRFQLQRSGTDVMIFKTFSPKKSAKNWRFLLKTKLKTNWRFLLKTKQNFFFNDHNIGF